MQSFRLNSNYFERHKKPYYVSNHPYHSAAHSSLQLNLMFSLYWKTGSFMKQTWLFLTSKPAHMQFSLQGNSPPTSFPQLCQELFCPYQPLRTTWVWGRLLKYVWMWPLSVLLLCLSLSWNWLYCIIMVCYFLCPESASTGLGNQNFSNSNQWDKMFDVFTWKDNLYLSGWPPLYISLV